MGNANGHGPGNRAVLYARVSTSEQAEHGASLPSQVEACRRYAETHEMTLVQEIVVNESGMSLDRQGLDEVRDMVHERRVDVVLVYSSDRLTRKLSHSLLLREELKRADVALHYVTKGVLADTPEAKMQENIESVFNEYWREKIIEASKRGKRQKLKQGKWVYGVTPYGYSIADTESGLEVNLKEAAVIRRVFNLYSGRDGKPMAPRAIAEILTSEGIPTPGAGENGRGTGAGETWLGPNLLRTIIKKTYYKGVFEMGGKVHHYPELAIVEEEVWDAAQDIIKRNRRKSKSYTTEHAVYLLSGRLRCTCGWAMISCSNKKKYGRYRAYRCNQQKKRGVKIADCSESQINAADLEPEAWQRVVGIISNEERLDELITEMVQENAAEVDRLESELAIAEGELDKMLRKIQSLLNTFGNEEDPDIAGMALEQVKQAKKTKQELEAHCDHLRGKIAAATISPDMREEIKAMARKARRRVKQGGTPENKQALFEALNVQGQVCREDGERAVRLTWGFGESLGIVRLDNRAPTPSKAPTTCLRTSKRYSSAAA